MVWSPIQQPKKQDNKKNREVGVVGDKEVEGGGLTKFEERVGDRQYRRQGLHKIMEALCHLRKETLKIPHSPHYKTDPAPSPPHPSPIPGSAPSKNFPTPSLHYSHFWKFHLRVYKRKGSDYVKPFKYTCYYLAALNQLAGFYICKRFY